MTQSPKLTCIKIPDTTYHIRVHLQALKYILPQIHSNSELFLHKSLFAIPMKTLFIFLSL